MNWEPLRLSLQVTSTATIGIVFIGITLALMLARTNFRGKLLIETLIYLPLVLPPTVIGYYLLQVLGRGSFLSQQLQISLLFTWQAAAIAAMTVGLPLMVQTARAAFEEVEVEIEDAARADGASEWQVLWHVTLPLARRGIVAGLILSAARAMGEFGATVMVAGSIPGQTQTLPLAIYDAIQARRFDDASVMVALMTSLAFGGLWLASHLVINEQKRAKRHKSYSRSGHRVRV